VGTRKGHCEVVCKYLLRSYLAFFFRYPGRESAECLQESCDLTAISQSMYNRTPESRISGAATVAEVSQVRSNRPI
jgi:hypothetical protein